MSLKPLCQVRGTPASGKSTLSVLIHHYIKQQEPTRRVIWIDGWHPETVQKFDDWRAFLRSKGVEPGDGSIVIIDEAQSSCWDRAVEMVSPTNFRRGTQQPGNNLYLLRQCHSQR